MHDPDDTDRDFTRVMVGLPVNDAERSLTALEIEQVADDLPEWRYRLERDFLRARIADRMATLSRAELETLAIQPSDCCTQRSSTTGPDLGTLSDDDLRERLVDAAAFVGMAA